MSKILDHLTDIITNKQQLIIPNRFTYSVRLRRPHGDVKTGLSRERYEEVTKDIRFKKYEECFDAMGTTSNCVIIGHHQDDVDENRITELGKGTLVSITV